MRPLNIPDVLIVLGLLGTLGLVLYNWTHPRGCSQTPIVGNRS
jgi:hypothetical protein